MINSFSKNKTNDLQTITKNVHTSNLVSYLAYNPTPYSQTVKGFTIEPNELLVETPSGVVFAYPNITQEKADLVLKSGDEGSVLRNVFWKLPYRPIKKR